MSAVCVELVKVLSELAPPAAWWRFFKRLTERVGAVSREARR